jgi:hypothetical protein
MPQALHVYLIFLVQERALSERSRVVSSSCSKVQLKKDVVEDGNLVVVRSASIDNCFVEVSEIAIGLWRVVLRGWI